MAKVILISTGVKGESYSTRLFTVHAYTQIPRAHIDMSYYIYIRVFSFARRSCGLVVQVFMNALLVCKQPTERLLQMLLRICTTTKNNMNTF